jgi:hypothetical protein
MRVILAGPELLVTHTVRSIIIRKHNKLLQTL